MSGDGLHDRLRLLRWLGRTAPPQWGENPEDLDPHYIRHVRGRVRPVFGGGYFRVSVAGWENLPSSPAMLVSNHSGGTSVLDVWGLLYAWHDHFGGARPIHTLGHDFLFASDRVGSRMARLGVLRASPGIGQTVLERCGRDLLVMPGGDRDVWRPYRDRYRVRFAGRRGYARLALCAGVPIVPIANAGPHETLVVLTDGQRIARALHLHELARADIFPIHLSLPWGLAIGPWPHIPPPAHLRYAIGRPVPLPARAGREPSEAVVLDYDARVRQALQALLDGLRRRRRRRVG